MKSVKEMKEMYYRQKYSDPKNIMGYFQGIPIYNSMFKRSLTKQEAPMQSYSYNPTTGKKEDDILKAQNPAKIPDSNDTRKFIKEGDISGFNKNINRTYGYNRYSLKPATYTNENPNRPHQRSLVAGTANYRFANHSPIEVNNLNDSINNDSHHFSRAGDDDNEYIDSRSIANSFSTNESSESSYYDNTIYGRAPLLTGPTSSSANNISSLTTTSTTTVNPPQLIGPDKLTIVQNKSVDLVNEENKEMEEEEEEDNEEDEAYLRDQYGEVVDNLGYKPSDFVTPKPVDYTTSDENNGLAYGIYDKIDMKVKDIIEDYEQKIIELNYEIEKGGLEIHRYIELLNRNNSELTAKDNEIAKINILLQNYQEQISDYMKQITSLSNMVGDNQQNLEKIKELEASLNQMEDKLKKETDRLNEIITRKDNDIKILGNEKVELIMTNAELKKKLDEMHDMI